MSLKWGAVAIVIAGLGLAAYGIWTRIKDPPRVISTSTIEIAINSIEDGKTRLRTRTLASGSNTWSEIELPNGTWIDCARDCTSTARKATIEFWQEQQRRR